MKVSQQVRFLMMAATIAISGAAEASVTTTLAGWTGNPIIDPASDQDSTWTQLGYDVTGGTITKAQLGTTPITLDEIEILGVDTYLFDFNFNGSTHRALVNGDAGWVGYTIELNTPQLDPEGWTHFLDVTLGSTTNHTATTQVDKWIFTNATDYNNKTNALAHLSSTNGADAGPLDLMPPLLGKIWVYETFSASGGGALFTVANTYRVGLPEPVSLSLFGIGLGIMGFVRRRLK